MAILRDSGFSGAKATQGVPVACACTLLGKQAPPERFDPRETAVTATLPSRHPRSVA